MTTSQADILDIAGVTNACRNQQVHRRVDATARLALVRTLCHIVRTRAKSIRHRWLACGVHGLGKTLHGLNRAVRRGLTNMKIQALMTATATATAINLKRLAKAILLLLVSNWLLQKTMQPETA